MRPGAAGARAWHSLSWQSWGLGPCFRLQTFVSGCSGFRSLLTVSQEKPRKVDSRHGKEAKYAHAGLWILPCPDPNNRVQEGLCEERDPRDLGAILLQGPIIHKCISRRIMGQPSRVPRVQGQSPGFGIDSSSADAQACTDESRHTRPHSAGCACMMQAPKHIPNP